VRAGIGNVLPYQVFAYMQLVGAPQCRVRAGPVAQARDMPTRSASCLPCQFGRAGRNNYTVKLEINCCNRTWRLGTGILAPPYQKLGDRFETFCSSFQLDCIVPENRCGIGTGAARADALRALTQFKNIFFARERQKSARACNKKTIRARPARSHACSHAASTQACSSARRHADDIANWFIAVAGGARRSARARTHSPDCWHRSGHSARSAWRAAIAFGSVSNTCEHVVAEIELNSAADITFISIGKSLFWGTAQQTHSTANQHACLSPRPLPLPLPSATAAAFFFWVQTCST